MVAAIEQGFPQREIAEASYRFQQAVERREQGHRRRQRLRAGRTSRRCRSSTSTSAPPTSQLRAARASCAGRRDNDAVAPLARRAARRPRAAPATRCTPLLDCVRAYATVGEMCDALRDVWGEYEEVPSSESDGCQSRSVRTVQRAGAERRVSWRWTDACERSASSSPSPGSTGTTAAPRSSPARSATPAWK